MSDLQIFVQATPNPIAHKFVLSEDVKRGGKATYRDPAECDNELSRVLFDVPGVDQVHFFENVITATINPSVDFSQIEPTIKEAIQFAIPRHNPDFKKEEEVQAPKREDLPEDLRQIEEILDRTIRPGLQADGGGLEVISYVDNQLSVRYQGACGGCPSSMFGTLQAINSILQHEFDPDIEVIPV
jgi:Fe-S cluster biogenesis protein NfuA